MDILEQLHISRQYCVALHLAQFKVIKRNVLKTTEK